MAHILGPGGAGKSTAGTLLASRFGLRVVDLDLRFIERHGNIARFIGQHGYVNYARANVRLYRALIDEADEPLVVVLSSGFMTYPSDVETGHSMLVAAIAMHPLTVMLLPSFNAEQCVALIVQRQLQRPYLNCDGYREEARIRQRLPLFLMLPCRRLLSSPAPAAVAEDIRAILATDPSFRRSLESGLARQSVSHSSCLVPPQAASEDTSP